MAIPLIPLVRTVIEWDNVSSSLLKLRFLSFKPFFPFFLCFTVSCLRCQWDWSAALLGLFGSVSYGRHSSNFHTAHEEPSTVFLKHCGVAHHKVDLRLKGEF
ncbi:hypothetical protein NC653_012450 [Populus alba x Populus x berolinensis]|uniref:Uncharacterized protein n=1 Tax=Populus alba x Populus x berolinensis TaxID=444605 RepID=A0AAD6QS64_9ROSI|nr:hypothetical protein NC653_012450 [Populus alba x Populus x berolinensis]